MPRCRFFSLLLFSLTISLSCLSQQFANGDAHRTELRRTSLGIQALQRWYVRPTGLYRTTGWWNAANAITVVTDYMRASGSKQYLPVLANTFDRAQIVLPRSRRVGIQRGMTGNPGFLNNYYDDEGWWALAWVDAYDLTGSRRYLAMSKSIFADMTQGWDATCEGGIWWSKDRTYKNAIANELFFSVAAHLALRTSTPVAKQEYATWAAREWAWFERSGMINADHLVNDGLTIDKVSGTCRNNGKTVWTYNQGVIVGALTEWAKAAHQPSALQKAEVIADAAVTHLTDQAGVLHDPCEPNCGSDGVQFKGIFVRNLRALNGALPGQGYSRFFRVNAESIWTKDRDRENEFGVTWSGPFSSPGAGTQASALDALITEAYQRQH
jgi:predicted alpha-1,6-mannanase (GH76 family)